MWLSAPPWSCMPRRLFIAFRKIFAPDRLWMPVSHDKDDQQLSVLSGHLGEIDASVSWCATEALPLLEASATSSGSNAVTAARAAVAAILSGAADTFQLGLASHAATCANDPESSAAWEGVLSLCSKIVDEICTSFTQSPSPRAAVPAI